MMHHPQPDVVGRGSREVDGSLPAEFGELFELALRDVDREIPLKVRIQAFGLLCHQFVELTVQMARHGVERLPLLLCVGLRLHSCGRLRGSLRSGSIAGNDQVAGHARSRLHLLASIHQAHGDRGGNASQETAHRVGVSCTLGVPTGGSQRGAQNESHRARTVKNLSLLVKDRAPLIKRREGFDAGHGIRSAAAAVVGRSLIEAGERIVSQNAGPQGKRMSGRKRHRRNRTSGAAGNRSSAARSSAEQADGKDAVIARLRQELADARATIKDIEERGTDAFTARKIEALLDAAQTARGQALDASLARSKAESELHALEKAITEARGLAGWLLRRAARRVRP